MKNPFLLAISLCQSFIITAQVKHDNLSIDYLTYSYEYYEHQAVMPGNFFTVVSSSSAKIIIPEGKRGIKKYYITDDGSFLYSYPNDADTRSRPMAGRTFYLETMRQGILPADLSYPDFLAMTLAEKRVLLAAGEIPQNEARNGKLLDATVKYAATPEGMRIFVSRGSWKAELKPGHEIDPERNNMMYVQLLPHKITIPPVVRNLLDPVERAKISSPDEFEELLEIMKQAGQVTDNLP